MTESVWCHFNSCERGGWHQRARGRLRLHPRRVRLCLTVFCLCCFHVAVSLESSSRRAEAGRKCGGEGCFEPVRGGRLQRARGRPSQNPRRGPPRLTWCIRRRAGGAAACRAGGYNDAFQAGCGQDVENGRATPPHMLSMNALRLSGIFGRVAVAF